MIADTEFMKNLVIFSIPGILANFCGVEMTKKKIKIKKTNRVSNKLVTLMLQNTEQINQISSSAPQLAIVTIATVPTNLDNPFSFYFFRSLLHNHHK